MYLENSVVCYFTFLMDILHSSDSELASACKVSCLLTQLTSSLTQLTLLVWTSSLDFCFHRGFHPVSFEHYFENRTYKLHYVVWSNCRHLGSLVGPTYFCLSVANWSIPVRVHCKHFHVCLGPQVHLSNGLLPGICSRQSFASERPKCVRRDKMMI